MCQASIFLAGSCAWQALRLAVSDLDLRPTNRAVTVVGMGLSTDNASHIRVTRGPHEASQPLSDHIQHLPTDLVLYFSPTSHI
jgi:hypothetical protein